MNARPRQALLEFSRPRLLAGVDEAGRGPLAGPVVAAAVILNRRRPIRGLADSKVLEPAERERLAALIRERAVAWSVAWADREEIDAINILQASLLAMRRALLGLRVCPDAIQFDGNICPSLDGLRPECPAVAIVDGDALVPAISAASILAKTFRDAWMRRFDELYPHYGFASHKGYGTPQHHEALDRHGICPLHRRSFAPVQCAESGSLLPVQFVSSEVASFAMADLPFANAVNPSLEAPRRRPASDGRERHVRHRK